MLRAVTFDYWRTLLWEVGSDLRDRRIDLWTELLAERGSPPDRDVLEAAHQVAFEAAAQSWLEGTQYRAEHAAADVVEQLGLPGEVAGQLTELISSAGLGTDLQLAPGIESALAALHADGLRLAIVCDVGLTPSPVLRAHLERRGLLRYFDAWAFSDEVGCYKPSVEIFDHALNALRVPAAEAWHVGDLRRTDTAGSRAAGMVSVRYRGIFDDTSDQEEADHVVDTHDELLELIRRHSGADPTRH